MPSPLTRVPPVVNYRGAGYAYLLAWVRTTGGILARITWVETYTGEHGQQWRWEVAEVPTDKVEQVRGQIYSSVPVEHRAETPEEKPERPVSWRKRRH
ncbi:hypothetical protein CDO52_13045 [Nocardiopsis gilva YIM 90087]|uniref:Uncharacterized protein n=1 Tax=Nocardiopsis gilva YIM 90087 TaxID=1235441 RepID=A0A223S652_9ACTN|nr:hypothetical protein [Nocardiopsis gilva]ASU83596.1 hypothetical protein CDO52_13045 [Nocardiopsis gilva YIM 90087]